MYHIWIEARASCGSFAPFRSIRDFFDEDLSKGIARALYTLDTMALEGINLGPLLISDVELCIRVSPDVKREGMLRAWSRAVCEMNEIVEVVPEDPVSDATAPRKQGKAVRRS